MIMQGEPVWMVGQIRAIVQPVEGYDGFAQLWEFIGTFQHERDAINACRDYTYFVMGPFPFGIAAPHETTHLPAWFPIERTTDDPALPGE